MPEGDTVFRTCAGLQQALGGRVLLAAELRWPTLAAARLAGMTVVEVVSRGKHILIRLDSGWTLHSHLLMEGQWRIAHSDPTLEGARNERPSRRAAATWTHNHDLRAILVTAEWTALGLRLGQLDLVRTAAEQTLVGHLGPDILAADFDPVTAVANLAGSGTTVGAALLDQRNLAGVGTFWASESLFLEGLGPWATEVPDGVLLRVVRRAERLMVAAARDGIQTSTGSTQRGRTSYVHGRSGRPCRRCGTTVRVAPIGPPTRERVLFYCPGCQGGLAPTDDGRPAAPMGSGRRPRR